MSRKALALLGHTPHVAFSILLMLWLDDVIYWDFWVVFVPMWLEVGALLLALLISLCKRKPDSNHGPAGVDIFAMLIVALSLLSFSAFMCLRLQETVMWRWTAVAIPLYALGIASFFGAIAKPQGSKFVGMAIFAIPIAVFALLVSLHMDSVLQCSWFVVFVPAWVLYGVLLVMILVLCCVLVTGPISNTVPVFGGSSCLSLFIALLMVGSAFVFTLFVCMQIAGTVDWQWAHIFIPLFGLQILACLSSLAAGPSSSSLALPLGRSSYSRIQ